MPSEQKPRARVTLTKAHLSHDAGRELLDRLVEITHDGELTIAEIKGLQAWLEAQRKADTVPAIAFLFEVVNEILADGQISREERVDLVLAIERALPKEQRIVAQQRRQEVESLTGASRSNDPDSGIGAAPVVYPATDPQLRYIAALGGTVPADCTIDQASRIIEGLLSSSDSVTRRQRMVLRFWDRVELAKQGRAAVSDWLDQWYAGDPNRHAAWQLWKEENHGDGRHADPETVPCGVGFQYLNRVRPPAASKRSASGCAIVIAALSAIAALAATAIASLR